jgi:hypothetical protein
VPIEKNNEKMSNFILHSLKTLYKDIKCDFQMLFNEDKSDLILKTKPLTHKYCEQYLCFINYDRKIYRC